MINWQCVWYCSSLIIPLQPSFPHTCFYSALRLLLLQSLLTASACIYATTIAPYRLCVYHHYNHSLLPMHVIMYHCIDQLHWQRVWYRCSLIIPLQSSFLCMCFYLPLKVLLSPYRLYLYIHYNCSLLPMSVSSWQSLILASTSIVVAYSHHQICKYRLCNSSLLPSLSTLQVSFVRHGWS